MEKNLQTRIKRWLIFFIAGLIISGITAFSIESELSLIAVNTAASSDGIQFWISTVYHAVKVTNATYPFLSYGTDWLAFAHIVIAIVFVGPLLDPVRNIWVLKFGMIACVLIFPLAFIAGSIRHIPIIWKLIDCSFGLIGLVPLYISYKCTRKLEYIQTKNLTFHNS